MSTIVTIIGTAMITAPCFYVLGAVMAASSDANDYVDGWLACHDYGDAQRDEAAAEHDRCADALETARNRIEYALEQETPNAAHGVKKMCRILRGEQG